MFYSISLTAIEFQNLAYPGILENLSLKNFPKPVNPPPDSKHTYYFECSHQAVVPRSLNEDHVCGAIPQIARYLLRHEFSIPSSCQYSSSLA